MRTAFAHFPFTRDDLGADYDSTSLHKWLHAPIGTGFLYVRRDKIKTLWPLMAGSIEQEDNIRKYEEIGTHPAANHKPRQARLGDCAIAQGTKALTEQCLAWIDESYRAVAEARRGGAGCAFGGPADNGNPTRAASLGRVVPRALAAPARL